jgi:hypothetical protein
MPTLMVSSADGANRNAGHPIRMQVGFRDRLVDAGLIGAERAAALQQQNGLLEPRTFGAKLFCFWGWQNIHDR